MTSIEELFNMQREIMDHVPGGNIPEAMGHQMTCGFGIIEEAIEYLNSIGKKQWRPEPLPKDRQIEELADLLHFFIELIIRSEFTWEQLTEAYVKKHAINMKRYADVAKGDLSWDDKGEKDEL